jgi:pyruvate-formate lyase-activating enzyme
MNYLCILNYKNVIKIQLEVNKGAMLPLMEEFYTIQGEGFHTGTAAYFVRIGGCDVGCHWCDVRKLECRIASSSTSIRLYPMQKKYSETVVVTGGAIDVGYDPIDPDA